jgi:hypothetical protein
MGVSRTCKSAWCAIAALMCGAAASSSMAQDAVAQSLVDADQASRVSAFRPESDKAQASLTTRPIPTPVHPLTGVVKFARQEQAYLQQTVRDFMCRLVKRERIEGIMQDYHFIDMKVREPRSDDGPSPFSIYLRFLAPSKVAGRQVLYVDGQNDGKMMVRNGGKRFDYVIVDIDPDSESAKRESLMPITRTGFNDMLVDMIKVLERHMKVDPSGANTLVTKTSGAKINKRLSTLLRIVHPKPQEGLEFHLVNVYVDDELHVPVRVEYYDWPKSKGQAPPLVAEYTYTQLKINVGLTDEDFDRTALKAKK